MFALSPILSKNSISHSRISEKNNTEDLKISVEMGAIYINNNWSSAKAQGICSGSGTISDPYVIIDLIIDGGGLGPCIHIRNSDVYFKIEKCILFNSGYVYGILLVDVNNSQIINNNCSNNGGGIWVVRGEYNVISGNNVYNNNGTGIELYSSDNNIVSGNIVKDNGCGIQLRYSDYNEISGNTVKKNDFGIILDESDNNTVPGNTANDNNEDGMVVYRSNGNDILENAVSNNENGIRLRECHDNDILENAVNGSNYGIWFQYLAYGNIISRNTVSNNFVGIIIWTPMSLASSYNNVIYYNCISNNTHNGYDNGTNNQWDSGAIGNYWSNYTGLDEDNDGIGDVPHNIDGEVGAQDNFPLMECPLPIKKEDTSIPGYDLFLLYGFLSVGLIILSKKIKKP
ncbi:MAG: right-handed parallel beta-helix repeat-containing protein [Candidatus Lokiarchaeota archaeon]|nr:right-handed parallel beta-helix repeat-containing protein [Candidatus Lokiarchaeota archaeon]